jgi:cytochrome c peroxidase
MAFISCSPGLPGAGSSGGKAHTAKQDNIAAFKTPDIRNVAVTAPDFHDGSQQTLWDVVDHYNKGDGVQAPWLDQDIQVPAASWRSTPLFCMLRALPRAFSPSERARPSRSAGTHEARRCA